MAQGTPGMAACAPDLTGETDMRPRLINRRNLIATGGAAAAVTLGAGLIVPARAAGVEPTPTMPGGANNYRPGAALTDRIGNGGFTMTGTVRTLVAVGTWRLWSIFAARVFAMPLSGATVSSASWSAASAETIGVGDVGASAGMGASLGLIEVVFAIGAVITITYGPSSMRQRKEVKLGGGFLSLRGSCA